MNVHRIAPRSVSVTLQQPGAPSPSTTAQVAAVYASLSLLRTGHAWHGISRAFLFSLSFICDPGRRGLFNFTAVGCSCCMKVTNIQYILLIFVNMKSIHTIYKTYTFHCMKYLLHLFCPWSTFEDFQTGKKLINNPTYGRCRMRVFSAPGCCLLPSRDLLELGSCLFHHQVSVLVLCILSTTQNWRTWSSCPPSQWATVCHVVPFHFSDSITRLNTIVYICVTAFPP